MSFNFFDRVYCIHLPHEKERRKLIEQQFQSVGIKDVQFVGATPPPKSFSMSNMRRNSRGEFGVNLSQIKAVVQAINDSAKRPLFFEDDIYFTEDASQRLEKALTELPSDYGVFFMGGHPRGPVPARKAKKAGDVIWKIQRYSFADAYSINGNQLTAFHDYWLEHITQAQAMYDFILGEFAGKTNSYSVYPILCEQRPGYSAVTLQNDNKDSLIARGWAAHIGPENLSKRHRKTFKTWKSKNPEHWESTLRNMAKKK